jgi:glutamate-1-semialdehyde 2,1-aminomutase
MPHFDRPPTRRGCTSCAQVCSERGIVLIFDEVFVGFRLAPGGAQEYFGVRADMVTYGKTLGGGLPVGVVCGSRELMKRFREDRPADICFARGTFNAHPYVMGAMHVFLGGSSARRCGRLRRPRRALERSRGSAERPAAPKRACRCRWRTCRRSGPSYTQPSRYNWMLQYYLRAAGPGAELGRQRAADLQPELHGRRLRRSCQALRRRGTRRCRPTAGGGRCRPTRATSAIRAWRSLIEMLRQRL